MGKHAFSLKTIYLAALTAVFAVSFFAFVAFDLYSQQRQTEQAMLEEARTFAREMDAVWQFMDNSQSIINNSSSGGYEFKGLHCSVVGKSVGRLFSAGSDYHIRYTNFDPRSEQDIPDEFETKALEAFNADRSVTEYYGVAPFDGEDRFRYLQALEVDDSCLECHGEPVGELDITDHAKEGWTLESVGGAISIVIPLDQQQAAMRGNVIRDMAYFLLITVFIGLVILVVTTVFVLRPLGGMHAAFGELKQGRLGASVSQRFAAKEVRCCSMAAIIAPSYFQTPCSGGFFISRAWKPPVPMAPISNRCLPIPWANRGNAPDRVVFFSPYGPFMEKSAFVCRKSRNPRIETPPQWA